MPHRHSPDDVQIDQAAGQPLAMLMVRSLADTDRLAACLNRHLPARCCLGLVGTLGAGKTRLMQGLAQSIAIDPQSVTSPTFTLVQQYQGDRLLYHLDAYRVADDDEFWELGVEEMFQQQAVTVVEWADRVAASLPGSTLWIRITLADGEQRREVRLSGAADLWGEVACRVANDYAAVAPGSSDRDPQRPDPPPGAVGP